MLSLIAASIITCLSLSVVDGDTIRCNGERMRLLGPGLPNKSGVDAPEIFKASCDSERRLGLQAKRRLEELLEQPYRIELSGKRDRYKRPLIWIKLPNGETAGELLIRERYAMEWNPRRKIDWCRLLKNAPGA